LLDIFLLVVSLAQAASFWLFFLASPNSIGWLGGILVGTFTLFLCVLLTPPMVGLIVLSLVFRKKRGVVAWLAVGLLLLEAVDLLVEFLR
jgi:hypothetical protein